MDFTDIIISTKSSWLDILYYYVLSILILFVLFVIKRIVEESSNNVFIVFGVIFVLILSSIQLILTGYEYDIPCFINFKSESIKFGGVIFSILYIFLMPRKCSK
ncbi:hypothetical protein [Photorhabdus heterorhabditis]|uniref:hypothetical protein n=1 Tax=Photorhabdus heterorhabditis TaxID=880156 RepID=UPI001561B98E|nr:hypothetical protein [Photorhabdus heterorhabditis]NRN29185.1 hypothetical protein [Photorhabdus heterorhabditis subsp. aluminescens]